MHHCLSTPEVIYLICREFFTDDGAVAENTRTLASLARVNRLWCGVALGRLWYKVWGIESLIRCMPDDLWTLHQGQLYITRPLKDSDLQIFHKYAPRVRFFVLKRTDAMAANSPSPYHALSLSIGAPILPNLVGLTWEGVSASVFPYINLFLCERLQKLRIRIDTAIPEQVGLLNTIPTKLWPNISNVVVKLPLTDYRRIMEGLGNTFSGWQKLCTLGANDLSLEVLLAIATLPNLRKLILLEARDIWVAHNQEKDQSRLLVALTSLENPFPALEFLRLRPIDPVMIMTKLFKLFRGAKLQELGLWLTARHDTPENVTELLQTIGSHCDHLSLKKMGFKYSSSGEPTLPFSVLTPLLQFSRLESVTVLHYRGTASTIISGGEVLRMASAWPNIRQLVITPYIANPSASPLTLLALLPLISRCPNLCLLGLPIDATNEATRRLIGEKPEVFEGVRNYSTRTLQVGSCPVSHEEVVASFLSEVFPNLKDIDFKVALWPDTEDRSLYERRWRYIAQVLLPLLARAKEREKKFAGTRK